MSPINATIKGIKIIDKDNLVWYSTMLFNHNIELTTDMGLYFTLHRSIEI